MDPTNCLRHQITFLYFISFPRSPNLKLSHLARLFFYFLSAAFFIYSERAQVQFRKRIEKMWTVIRVGLLYLCLMVRRLETSELLMNARTHNEAALCNRSQGMRTLCVDVGHNYCRVLSPQKCRALIGSHSSNYQSA